MALTGGKGPSGEADGPGVFTREIDIKILKSNNISKIVNRMATLLEKGLTAQARVTRTSWDLSSLGP